MKETLTEVKISVIRKRTVETNEKKTYQSTDRVTVLGLVCEKMAERVMFARQEEEDRRVREEVSSITQDDTSDEEDLEYDEGFQDERHIWEVTHVSEYYYCDLKIWKRLPRRVTVWIYYLNSQTCGMVTGEQRRDGERFVLS